MKLSHEEVREILSIVEASSFDSIEVKFGDVQIAASKSGAIKSAGVAPPPPPREEDTHPVAASPVPTDMPVEEEGLIEVTAPIVGTFFVASEPGATPFVKEGDIIDEDTTVGVIEVMKVFNDVRAGKKGKIVHCLVQDGVFVEFKQPIFLIRPEM